MSTPQSPRWLGPVYAFAGALGFSAKAIFIKIAYSTESVDSVTLLALRMLVSLPFFLAMIWWGNRQRPAHPVSTKDWKLLALFGFLGYYLSSFLDFLGLQFISAALERLILFTYPATVLILSALFFRRPIHAREILAILLSFGGIGLVFLQDLRITQSPRDLWIGSLLIFLASLTYAVYLVGNTALIHRIGATRFTGMAAAISSVFVLGHFLATHPLRDLAIPSKLYPTVLALAVVSTALPVWLTNEALRLVGPSRVAIMSSIGPIVTIWLGGLFLGEPVSAVSFAGAALVLSGVSLVAKP